MSFLGIEGYHAFVTGARGGIGQALVAELLAAGCRVTAHDLRPPGEEDHNLVFPVHGDISNEASIAACMQQAVARNGPINILCANAGITNEANHPDIWEMPVETWDDVYRVNIRGTFLTIKHFLLVAKNHQDATGQEIENLAIVVTGSECGKFGQAGHSEYASGKAGLQYGLVPTVKNEIVRLNAKARINAVAPGWVNTALIGDRLDDPREFYMESQGTVSLRKIAEPVDVAKTVAFLASHRASGHMSGQCLSVDGGMEGRIVWREEEILGTKPQPPSTPQSTGTSASGVTTATAATAATATTHAVATRLPQQISRPKPRNKVKFAVTVDFDAISSWLGTGANPDNSTADYSAGYFSANVGVPRLLKVLQRLGLADKTTWCIPGHSMETFPVQAGKIAASGAEIALHGYAHEASSQMTAEQERAVVLKCIDLVKSLTGKPPRGYRAPLYKLSERTLALLQELGFLWDSSLTHHDSTPYLLPADPAAIEPIAFGPLRKAESWMRPSPDWARLPKSELVEIPCNWYMEDATPLQYYPKTPNSHGYVDVRVVERMWMDRLEWLRGELADGELETKVFTLCLHPDTSGHAHVIGMLERFLKWARGFDDVEFMQCGEIAAQWKQSHGQE